MLPISRGSLPEDYSILIGAEISEPTSLAASQEMHDFDLDGVHCLTSSKDGYLAVEAHGFATEEAARAFFANLSVLLGRLSLSQRLPIFFPEPSLPLPFASGGPILLLNEETKKRGWPETPIELLLIFGSGSWIYPQHKFVAFEKVHGIRLQRDAFGVEDLTIELRAIAGKPLSGAAPAATTLAAAKNYAYVTQGAPNVWGFMLTIISLEMFAREEGLTGQQKSRNLQTLVGKYCAPGIASEALHHFTDAADCEEKIAACYSMRNMYMHEGSVAGGLKYGFFELYAFARDSLAHILKAKLPA